MYGREGDRFTLAAAGDAIITRRLSTCEADDVQRVVDRIRAADVGIINLEVLLHDYDGYPSSESGGTYMRAPPWAADELTWAGFDMFAAANNHIGDFSHGGMEVTMDALEDREIPYAGLGRSLAEARAPAYAETPGGRVGLVATCSTITPGSIAGDRRPDMGGRPGLAPLRLETTFEMPSDAYETVQQWSEAFGLEAVKESRGELGFPIPGEDEEGFTFLNPDGANLQFTEGDAFSLTRTPKDEDIEATLERIRAADRQADWVVASLHGHEGEGAFHNDHSIPTFYEEFAHACIDAGADIFIGHGPHVLRGIEIYDGAPVFYSLGDFLMQNETVSRLPAEIYDRYDLSADALPPDLFDERVFDEDGNRIGFLGDSAFWESVLPVCRFDDGALDRIELHPLELGFEAPRPQRGRPRLATGETATRILEELAELSEPYDTDIGIEDGKGIITI
ncbi:MAG: CapA family protein [Halobacteriales archaeon]|nr:CapA family protein [Halobacteriales archaeon]